MDNVVKVSNLLKKYPEYQLGPLNFELETGTITGLIGENGAGKTTLIKLLLNLINKDEGEITFWNQDINENNLKEKVGIVFDEVKFPEELTLKQFNPIFKDVYKTWSSEKYFKLLNDFDLNNEKKVKELSKGMKIKLQLAVALAHNPEILLLDEVTSGLDPVFRDDLLEILWNFIESPSHTVFCSSHNLTDIEKIADNIIFLNKGEIVFNEEKNSLLERFGILRVPLSRLNDIDKEDIFAIRKGTYSVDILVDNANLIKNKYDGVILDKATLDEIILLFYKGEIK